MRSQILRFMVAVAIISVYLMGCDYKQDQAIASFDSEHVYRNQLPVSDQIRIYDIEMQQHYMMLTSLRQYLESQSVTATPQLMLAPPVAPKINLTLDPAWQLGEAGAQTHIQLACTYQSAPCARIIDAINDLMPYLKTPNDQPALHLEFFDFALPFHRFALPAAHSISCIHSDQQSLYRKHLWNQQGQISTYPLVSGMILHGLSKNEAEDCLDFSINRNQASLTATKSSIQALKSAGIHHAPTLLINGTYIAKGRWESEIYRHLKPFISAPSTPFVQQNSEWSIELLGVWVTKQAQFHWAQILSSRFVSRVDEGSVIGPGIWIHAIHPNIVEVFKDGKIWSIQTATEPSVAQLNTLVKDPHQQNGQALTNKIDIATQSTQNHPSFDSNRLEKDDNFDQDAKEHEALSQSHQARLDRKIASLKRSQLSTQWLQSQIQRRDALEEQLHPTEHKIEGSSLLKLNNHEIDSFYTALGMEPGDVIVRVNGEWVYDGSNPLWQSLESSGDLTISVIRRGLPVHLGFEIASE